MLMQHTHSKLPFNRRKRWRAATFDEEDDDSPLVLSEAGSEALGEPVSASLESSRKRSSGVDEEPENQPPAGQLSSTANPKKTKALEGFWVSRLQVLLTSPPRPAESEAQRPRTPLHRKASLWTKGRWAALMMLMAGLKEDQAKVKKNLTVRFRRRREKGAFPKPRSSTLKKIVRPLREDHTCISRRLIRKEKARDVELNERLEEQHVQARTHDEISAPLWTLGSLLGRMQSGNVLMTLEDEKDGLAQKDGALDEEEAIYDRRLAERGPSDWANRSSEEKQRYIRAYKWRHSGSETDWFTALLGPS